MRQGNTYQVNYTLQLTQELNAADGLAIYNKLVVEQAAGYNAYIAHDEFAVISASPELFFKQEGNRLTTRPMKGTTKRGVNSWLDQQEHDWLQADGKNRSENMMIVDLLRNDMGKICQTGSVCVDKLCEVEQYSTVWQMTSTIIGDLKADCDLIDILTALFPCGSITGAPKVSTMAIIKSLEPNPREFIVELLAFACLTVAVSSMFPLEPSSSVITKLPMVSEVASLGKASGKTNTRKYIKKQPFSIGTNKFLTSKQPPR